MQKRNIQAQSAPWSFSATVYLYGFKLSNFVAVLLGDFGMPFSCELSYRLNHVPISSDVFSERTHVCCHFLIILESFVQNFFTS
jgi:hypothetical protein